MIISVQLLTSFNVSNFGAVWSLPEIGLSKPNHHSQFKLVQIRDAHSRTYLKNVVGGNVVKEG